MLCSVNTMSNKQGSPQICTATLALRIACASPSMSCRPLSKSRA